VIVGLIVIFGILLLIDLPYVMKNHPLKVLTVYSILMVIGFALSLMLVMDIHVTSPSQLIESIIRKM